MNENPPKEYGKEYFIRLLNNVYENLKMGDEFYVGFSYCDADGNVKEFLSEKITKEELYECD